MSLGRPGRRAIPGAASGSGDRKGADSSHDEKPRTDAQEPGTSELREEVRRYRDMVESSLGLICTHDLEGIILTANAAAAELLGWEPEELVGTNIRELLAPSVREEFPAYLERLEAHGRDSGIMQVVTRDGRQRFLKYRNIRRDIPGERPHVLGHSQDVTDQIEAQRALRVAQGELESTIEERTLELTEEIAGRQGMEEALRKSQRMEAVGLLAGGVAHDFNNLLTAIQGYAALARERSPGATEAHQAIEEIERAGQRAAELTRQLLAFSRQQVMHPKVVEVNEVIRSREALLRSSVGEIDLRRDLDAEAGSVRVDPNQLERALVNLALHARESTPDGGRVTIVTRRVEQRERREDRPELEPGSYAVLSVSDTGLGMDEQTRRRVFEPFYATKNLALGGGLELAMTYGIVKQSHGWIYVDSAPGDGSTFDIYLPSVRSSESEQRDPPPEARDLGGSETILLVEDDPLVSGLVTTVLESGGHRVLRASSGVEAMQILEGGAEIDLLVTDVVLPGLSGPEVAERVREQRPEVKTLFISGYASEDMRRRGVLESEGDFLRKPFTPAELAERVRRILDG